MLAICAMRAANWSREMHKAFLCKDEEAGNVNSYGCITHYLLGSECAILRKVYQHQKQMTFHVS